MTGEAYQALLEKWGKNQKLTALEYAIIDAGNGKNAQKAAAQLAEMERIIAEQAETISELRRELLERP